MPEARAGPDARKPKGRQERKDFIRPERTSKASNKETQSRPFTSEKVYALDSILSD